MVKLFTARELAECLGINPAKWKRWVREFLPPDPLAGMQSGYARQFYVNDAFTVYFAGHLVADLKFAITDARKILQDLARWMQDTGFRFNPDGSTANGGSSPRARSFSITVHSMPEGDFAYVIRGLVSRETMEYNGEDAYREMVLETRLGQRGGDKSVPPITSPRVIEVTLLRSRFLALVDPKRSYFPEN